ncbi:MAG: hypothetical protein WDO24_09895 [Pseudomonadota bacterium]
MSTVFGGIYEQVYRRTIADPFERETGAKVTLKFGAASEWLTNAMVNRRRPEIDLLLLPYPDSVKAVLDDIGLPLTEADIPISRTSSRSGTTSTTAPRLGSTISPMASAIAPTWSIGRRPAGRICGCPNMPAS